MQKLPEFTQEKLNFYIKNLADSAFDIDKESKVILGIIAKNGPCTETKITKLGKRRTILTREIIRRRLLKTDLSFDFLSVEKGKNIGNLPGKTEKIYHLTFKGFLASLSEVSIQENYWTKKYIKKITDEIDSNTSIVFLKHISCMIGVFLVLNSRRTGLLTEDQDLELDFSDYYFIGSTIHDLIRMRVIKKIYAQHKEFFIYCIIQFFVSCYVLGTLRMNVTDKDRFNAYDRIKSYNSSSENIFTDWMWLMFTDSDKISKIILKKQKDYEPISFIRILGGQDTIGAIRSFARDELRQIKPKRKFHEHTLLRKSGLSI